LKVVTIFRIKNGLSSFRDGFSPSKNFEPFIMENGLQPEELASPRLIRFHHGTDQASAKDLLENGIIQQHAAMWNGLGEFGPQAITTEHDGLRYRIPPARQQPVLSSICLIGRFSLFFRRIHLWRNSMHLRIMNSFQAAMLY
jgi:hypothetical protein